MMPMHFRLASELRSALARGNAGASLLGSRKPRIRILRPRMGCGAIALLAQQLLFAVSAAATTWSVIPADSKIAFSGQHAGNTFKGVFEKWEAVINFDPADLAGSKATVTVALASAKTGDQTYDKTLPTADWFDAAKGPSGVFETSAFRSLGGNKFEADGAVTIRGVKAPVTLAFEFKPSDDTAKLTGTAKLKRLDFGIGKGSDGDGSWVSLDIPVEISVSLKKS
jgi:polyisoprenoid-binding protein YceI